MAGQMRPLVQRLSYTNASRVVDDGELVLHYHGRFLTPTIAAMPGDPARTPLASLHGTLPIVYRGANYYIPVQFWFPPHYPINPPVAYVTPTPDMLLKPGHPHVDASGRCFFPYLHSWQPSSSKLLGLVEHMISLFGREPPVRARPAASPSPSPSPVPPPTPSPSPAAGPPPYSAHQFSPTPSELLHTVSAPAASFTSLPSAGPLDRQLSASSLGPTSLLQQQQLQQQLQQQKQQAAAAALRSQVTELLRGKLSSMMHEAAEDIGEQDMLKRTQTDDERTHRNQLQAADQQLQQLDAELAGYDREIELLNSYILANGSSRLDLDSFVLSTDPRYLLEVKLRAADLAYDDLIRVLEKALSRDVVTLPQFIASARNLARERFVCIAKLRKLAAMRAQSAPL